MTDKEFSLFKFVIGAIAVVLLVITIISDTRDIIQTWIKEAHKPANITLTIQTAGFKGADLLTKKEPL